MSFQAVNEVPSGPINSTDGTNGNGHFVLAHVPLDRTLVQIYSAGSLKDLDVHYTLNADQLDFFVGFHPIAGDSLLADYEWDVVLPAAQLAPDAAAGAGLTQFTDHVARAQSRLLQQYVDKPSLLTLVAALAGRTQVVENALWGLHTGKTLSNAVGVQLDGIGRIVGLPRSEIPSAADDEVYRIWLRSWIAVNFSGGTIPDIIALFQAVTPAGTTVQVFNSGPASFRVVLGGVAQTQGPALLAVLNSVKAAGVKASLDYADALPLFGFDGAGAGMDTGYLGGSV